VPDPAGAHCESALVALLAALKQRSYRFVTPTPATHERVVARKAQARHLRDVFGWNLPFAPDSLDAELIALLERAGALEPAGALLRSRLRAASLGEWLLLHSGFPTSQRDAVFFGPDSYRFANLIRAEAKDLALGEGAVVVDIGGGTGIGAMVAGSLFPNASVVMTEVNIEAVRLARVNIAAAGIPIRIVEADDLAGIGAPIDLAVVNPPYIADEARRTYRDGGGALGAGASLAMAKMAAGRLRAGGRLILYTGTAIVEGEDRLHGALNDLAAEQGLGLRYRELDPDVFGEELERPAYAQVERIALVAAILDRPA
jgi:methylase of polypeptide subunit release factors